MKYTDTNILTPTDETRYLRDYLPLVGKVVRQFAWQTSTVLDKDDMRQIALMGLLSSLRRYGHPDDGFAGYAVQRIRGAVLDELRKLDWRPRRLRQQTHKLNDAIRQLVSEPGKPPCFTDISTRLSMTFESWQAYLQLCSAGELESLESLQEKEPFPSSLVSRPLEEEMLVGHMLGSALAQLAPREQTIFILYYQHEMNLKEIGHFFGLTEARLCQLNKAISRKIYAFFTQDTSPNGKVLRL
ncbi:sigma-70 family RNA polymerase sigma factor [Kosakonia oryzendophytica]|uniref:sigma-70 family RNA polymerase sigma factor n=1 Tax=Kosakonia oryzendophytica TaxID=1005665 RepID=UPI003D32B797